MAGRKVILISVDGMRPDGLLKCGSPYVEELKKIASYTFCARTVEPSVTLPCHLSMFQSVPPKRHGTLTNTYVAPVHPVKGLFEVLREAKKRSAMYYGWNLLRDISRPGSTTCAEYFNSYTFDHTDAYLTDRAIDYAKTYKPEFIFLYLIETDEKGGHDNGWMTDVYLDYVKCAVENIKRVVEEIGDEYTVIVTADHGGHDRAHGTTMPEDMTIPMFFYGPEFEAGKELGGVSILDIAPTIASLIGVEPEREWEGRSLLK